MNEPFSDAKKGLPWVVGLRGWGGGRGYGVGGAAGEGVGLRERAGLLGRMQAGVVEDGSFLSSYAF